jgi:hypothetical protein
VKRSITQSLVLISAIAAVASARAAGEQNETGFDPGARLLHDRAGGLPREVTGICEESSAAVRTPGRAALEFAGRHEAFFGIEGEIELRAASSVSHLAQTIVRFGLRYRGLPVFLRRAAIQLDGDLAVRRAAAPPPVGEPPRSDHPRPECDEPGWLPIAGSLVPVCRVHAGDPSRLDARHLYLSARTLEPLHVEPLVHTSGPPLAATYPENPITTPNVAIAPLEHLDPPSDRLYGKYARVERCLDPDDCDESEPFAEPDRRGHFVFSPDLSPHSTDDCFAEVNAYHNISAINHWARQRFGWEGLFHDETWIRVKVGRAWYNAAFYRGNEQNEPFIVFGQDEIDMAYDADVAFHEFGHAINRSTWSHPWFFRDELGIDTSPFGVEEALADIWAQTFSGDPVMNSYVVPSRSADNDLTCPEALMGEGHMEARILSGFGWDVRRGIGAEAWDQIVYRTLSLLVSRPGFAAFAESLAASAEDLAAEGFEAVEPAHADLILERAAERGLMDEDCLKRIVPLPEGEHRRLYGYGSKRTGGHDNPTGIQWKLTAPEGERAFRLELEWIYPEDIDPGYRVHLSRGAPVEVDWIDQDVLPPESSEIPGFFAIADETLSGSPPIVDYPYRGLVPLEPGEEVYVLISADNEERIFVLDARAWFVERLGDPPQGSAPPPASSPPAAACGAPGCSISTFGISASRSGPLTALATALSPFDRAEN